MTGFGNRKKRIGLKRKSVLFLFLVFGNRRQVYNLCTDILCNLLHLKFPEMWSFDLELTAGYGDDAEPGLLNILPYFLAFADIDLHFFPFWDKPRHKHSNRDAGRFLSDIPTGLHDIIPLLCENGLGKRHDRSV